MKWHFEKFKGDMAIYAICPKCGFYYNSSTLQRDMTTTITNVYNFCPICGEQLSIKEEDVDVTWNQRDIADWLKGMEGKICD
jgi:hypothetical protein